MKRLPKKVIFTDPSQLGKLVCDAPQCGHIEPEPCTWGPDLIGKPCPRCGASLLVQADFDRVERMIKAVDLVNRILGPIFGRRHPLPGDQSIAVRMHGDQTDITINPGTPS
jgi:hypothetical protein